jgi:hypothetical protein
MVLVADTRASVVKHAIGNLIPNTAIIAKRS